MKLTYKERKLSMVDCIGYSVAQKWGVLFLTGDKEFEDIPGVVLMK